ncbi:MAG: hypothetical protein JSS11_14965 [Verrucomicrobia bacterium]|nr:hypothetical protein [Verrucomicrobiota bacterium]
MDAHPAPPLKITRWLVLLCLAVSAAAITWTAWDMAGPARRPMLQGWDDSYYYFWLPSVVIDHDLDFSNQVEQCRTMNADMREAALAAPRLPSGLPANKYPPGWAIGSLPFFLAAHVFMPAGSTGFEPPYLLAVWLGQWLYAAAGLWLAIKILARYFPPDLAAGAVLTVWLASPLVYYQTARLSMSHSQVFALAMAVFWLALRLRDDATRGRDWALLGFCSALLVVTRNVAVVYLALPAWVVCSKLRAPRAALWLALGALPPLAAQLLAWKILYGSWFAYSYGGERFDFTQLHFREILFSPRHGWFYWHPLLLAGIAGFLPWAWSRAEGRAWLVSLGLILVLSAAWPTWWLGSSFGYRGLEVPVFFAMLGVAVVWQGLSPYPRFRVGCAFFLGLLVAWNLVLFALFLTQRIPRQEPVTYGEAVRALLSWLAPGA